MQTSVVVVTFNSSLVIANCLEKLCSIPSLEIIVVDNDSSDSTCEIVASFDVTLIKQIHNTGFAQAANRGAQAASSPFLCFCNPDCEISAELLDEAVSALRSNPLSVAAPTFIHPGNESVPGIQPGYTRTKLIADILDTNVANKRIVTRLKQMPWYHHPRWQWPLGTCFFISRDLFWSVGGFSENYFLYMEDVDLGWKLRQQKPSYVLLKTPTVHHAQSGSDIKNSKRLKLLNRARLQFTRERFGLLLYSLLTAIIAYTKVVARK